MYLTIILLVIFFTNVLMGTLGGQPFLGDVGEMLAAVGSLHNVHNHHLET